MTYPGVSEPKRRKDGSLISFEFQGRRMRLDTLKHFLPDPQPKDSTMPMSPLPTVTTTPAPLAASLADVGIDAATLKGLIDSMNAARKEQSKPAEPKPSTPTPKKPRL